MFEKGVYVERRRRLREAVGTGVVLLLGNEESSINYKDNFYPFRQDSTFLYYFGIDQPDLAAVIDMDEGEAVVFGDDPTTEQMVWTGVREPLAAIGERIGVLKVARRLQ